MPKSFLVAPLPAERVGQALPVVQALDPALTPTRWQAMASPFLTPGAPRGIMACRMGTGHVRGLFCYALDGTGVLRIDPFAVAGLFDARATAEGLIEAIGQLAERFGAAGVTVNLEDCAAATVPQCDLAALFGAYGYRREGNVLTRGTAGMKTAAPAGTA